VLQPCLPASSWILRHGVGGKRACDEGDGMVWRRGHDKDGASAVERPSTRVRRRGIRYGVAEKAKTKTRSERGELACSGRRIRRRENRKENDGCK
jgi:hypothetical protein